MALVMERIAGCYEAQDVRFGKVYAWRPGRVVIECECGEGATLTGSATACSCGADHATTVREALAAERLGDEDLHPWRYRGDRDEAVIPY